MKIQSPQTVRTATLALIVIGLIVLALGGYLAPLFRITVNPLVGVQSWVSQRYMAFYDFLTAPRDVASLQQRNTVLESENSRLQAQVIELSQQLADQAYESALLQYAKEHTENRYAAAEVIGRDPSPFLQYIIIKLGSDDGIRHGMPVVTEQGLIGRISQVNAGASSVQLITDPSSAVNVRLQSSDKDAILTGSVTGDLTLDMIPQDLKIPNGEVVLTSGLGGVYPSNLMIGQVVSVHQKQNDLFQTASVQPVVDFSALKIVLIITNFKPVDITPLVPTQAP
jgi:rod shape-determining protein MreC